MEKSADLVVDWMIQCNVIDDEDRDLYRYALHSFFLLLLPFIYAGGIGFCMGNVKQGIALILPFMVLRKFSGGYHTKNLRSCILVSGFLLALCAIVSMQVKCDWRLAITTIIASISLIIFSPIDSENRRLDTDERKLYKKITVLYVIFFGLLDIILFLSGRYIYTICFSIGIQLAAGLQTPCVIKSIYLLTKKSR